MAADGLDAYLPSLVRRWLVDEPATRARELEGSLAFVDISGFTPLSERLARLGREGAEELAATIDACFARLLAVAYGEGGSLLKFGGDALLLFFSGPEHAVRAARAAYGMRRTLRGIGDLETPGGRVRLRMSVGVHTGAIHFLLVGRSHRELLVLGPGATTTVRMESAARAGEILVSHDTARHLPPSVLGDDRGAGVMLRREPAGVSPTDRDGDRPSDQGTVAAAVPAAIRSTLAAGHPEPEHRHVTVAFLHFDGTDELLSAQPGAATDALEALVGDVQAAADRHGVTFLTSDIDEDGGKLILVAGAPLTSGDDSDRMVLALNDIRSRAHVLPVRIGLHRGPVFAGDIGPAFRRTYTVMGDAVNLAARLMARARPGQIIATDAVVERCRTPLARDALAPFTVKGKRRPVSASAITGIGESVPARQPTDLRPLVGRATELEDLASTLASARGGRGEAVRVEGEAGVGKSRLLQELRSLATGMDVVELAGQPHLSATPYAAFRGPLRQLLWIADGTDRAAAGRRLVTAVGELAPELSVWAPLVALAVDVDVPTTSAIANLDERFRPARLRQVVVELVAARCAGPTLFVIEDAQWLDEASDELVASLCQASQRLPWAVLVASRPGGGATVAGGSGIRILALDPLPPGDTEALARLVTEDEPLPRHVMSELVRRSGGNPFFLAELTDAVRRSGGTEHLPESVEALIVARIDRLPARARRTLRHLSALGQRFPAELAERVVAMGSTPMDAALDDFLVREGPSLRFVHSLIHEAAYASLPFRTRRRLHATAGDAIRSTVDDPDRHADLLSFHFHHARRYPEAWRYALVAAEQARSAYANAAAAELYGRALAAARHVAEVDDHAVSAVLESLGDVRERMGAYQDALAVYRQARRSLQDDPVADARLMLKIARMHGWLRRFSQSLAWITRGLTAIEGATSDAADRQRAQLTAWYGHFLQEQGRPGRAIAWSLRAATIAAASGEREAQAHAYRTLDWAYVSIGQLGAARYSPLALDLYQALDDLTGQAHTLHNMASIAYLEGDWQGALAYNQRAEALYERIGNEVSVAFSRANMAEILLDQGHLAEADRLFAEVLHVSLAAGRRGLVAFARKNLGIIAARQGRYTDAESSLRRALAEYEDIGARAETVETDVRLAELELLRGSPASALQLTEDAATRAAGMGGVGMSTPAIHRTRGYALLLLGDVDAATAAFEEALRAARQRQAAFEVALCLAADADRRRVTGSSSSLDLAAEQDAILEHLGVVTIPRPPLPRAALQAVAG